VKNLQKNNILIQEESKYIIYKFFVVWLVYQNNLKIKDNQD